MITDVVDIFGNKLEIGDKVVFSKSSSTSNSYLLAGEIIDIKHKMQNTEVHVKITYEGASRKWYIGQTKKFIYPRYYNNLAKIN